jgi:hypothetical protein
VPLAIGRLPMRADAAPRKVEGSGQPASTRIAVQQG